ncbi:hypothetical protein [Oceanicaulis sp.]|uniref:hypothetical protein n=1 Tax=Oceanicaulis sp. TaxID=1924941 RepID=UPI003F72FDF9
MAGWKIRSVTPNITKQTVFVSITPTQNVHPGIVLQDIPYDGSGEFTTKELESRALSACHAALEAALEAIEEQQAILER